MGSLVVKSTFPGLRLRLLLLTVGLAVVFLVPPAPPTAAQPEARADTPVIDLSLLVAPELPCTWAGARSSSCAISTTACRGTWRSFSLTMCNAGNVTACFDG